MKVLDNIFTVAVYGVIAMYAGFAVIAVALYVVDNKFFFAGCAVAVLVMFLWEWAKIHVIQRNSPY